MFNLNRQKVRNKTKRGIYCRKPSTAGLYDYARQMATLALITFQNTKNLENCINICCYMMWIQEEAVHVPGLL